MPRKTRAAAKAEDAVFPDNAPEELETEAAIEEEISPPPASPASVKKGRGALRNITPNTSEIPDAAAVEDDMKGSKNKKGKGKKKGKKGKVEEEKDVADEVKAVEEEEQGPNEVAVEVPSFNGAVAKDKEELEEKDVEPIIELPVDPLSKSTRMTRRQIAQAEAEQTAIESKIEQPEQESTKFSNESTEDIKAPAIEEVQTPELTLSVEEQAERSIEAETVEPANNESPVKPEDHERTADEANESIQDNHQASTPDTPNEPMVQLHPSNTEALTSPVISVTQPEDPIDAIDALEDAIEEVGRILPGLDAPVSSRKTRSPKVAPAPAKTSLPSSATRTSKTTTPASSKASSKSLLIRASSVRASTSNKLVNSTQPSAISRTRIPPKTTATGNTSSLARSNSTKARAASVIGPSGTIQNGKAPDYLAAKRRPFSMSFPTPPPPPKSTKAPTKATFQLPGDAVAAKLKLQRQERLKREEEEAAKPKAFKARPAAKVKPVEVKQTAASRARLSIIGGVESNSNKENSGAVAGGGLKRSSTVTGATSNSAKRGSMIGGTSLAAKRASVMGPPSSTTGSKTASAANTAQKRNSTAFAANKDFSLSVSRKRESGVLSSSTAKRTPSGAQSSSIKPPVTAQDAAVQRVKGKEVFNRDRHEKEAREKERREKDEAMKKARVQAAERGRQASRDWAEKQKKALAEKKGLGKSVGPESNVTKAIAPEATATAV
ncbi:hypothetical protein EJ08DRAFT_653778 [Tothia fuscella]|uniref:Carboxylesterase family protein n=1 Tax=Tothia fuscella TaxID=1048955 RepID=A0A9P4TT70_9PEZI|nr:hypothetical protein EJ08DRAFT_653778 [Tothia fuscella]